MSLTRREMLQRGAAVSTGLCLSAMTASGYAQGKPADKKFKKAVKIGMVRHGTTLLEKFQRHRAVDGLVQDRGVLAVAE